MPQAPTVELPKQWPLVTLPENRGDTTSKDARLVNCYGEKQTDGSYQVYGRPGLEQQSRPPGANAVGRGMYNWLGDVYSIFGGTLYKNGVAIVGSVNTANGGYRWSSTLGATPRLQLGNGVAAYNYDAGAGLVQITDPQFPSSFVKGWAYLDGTTYVGTPTAHIQGSDINDPTAWDVLNDILAQIEPDQGVALAKQLVYVIFLKQWITEVFYDAGNATGSPLGTVQGAKVSYGCITADGVATIDDILFWPATNRGVAPQVVKLEGLKAEIISTDPIERLLDGADFTTTYAFTLKKRGHRFYVLTVVAANLTLVYDIDQRLWHQWTDASGNYFPFVAASFSGLTTLLQHESNGRIYTFDESFVTDNGDIIVKDIYTPNFDADTQRGKYLSGMYFSADQTPGSLLEVRCNDNDYALNSWTNFRTVDLGTKRPYLDNCGTFVRRAYHFRHRKATQFRIKAVGLQLDLCTI
jgi:hypothetical protein